MRANDMATTIAAQQQQVMAQQQSIAAAQRQAQSQQALRAQQGMAGLQQRKIQQQQFKKATGQVAEAQAVVEQNKQIQQEVAKQEAEYAKQQEQQAKVESALATMERVAGQSKPGYISYDPSVGSAIEELANATGMSPSESKKYYEGLVMSGGAYQKAAYESGIRESQSAFMKQLPEGTTVNWGVGGSPLGGTLPTGETFKINYAESRPGERVIPGAGAKPGELVGFTFKEAPTITQSALFGGGTIDFSHGVEVGATGGAKIIKKASTFSNLIGGVKNLFTPKKISKESYVSGIGEYGAFVSNEGFGDTGTYRNIRFPTTEEIKTIKEARIRDEALAAVPAQYLGTYFNKQIPEKIDKQIGQNNFFAGMDTFLNPKTQYEIAKYNVQYREDIKLLNKLNKPLNNLEVQFKEGKISEEEYNKKISEVISRPDYIEAYKRTEAIGGTPLQRLGASSLSDTKKGALSASARVVSTIPYFIPPTRVVLGVEAIREGANAYSEAENTSQKWMAGGQIALGTILTTSGAKGTYNSITGTKPMVLTASPSIGKVIKYGSIGGGTGLGVGFGLVDYYSTLKQTGSQPVAIGAGIGTGGTILIGTYAPYSPVKLKTRELIIPKEGGETKINILGLETNKGRAFVIGSYSEGRFGIGTPNIKSNLLTMPPTTEIKIGSALETKIIYKNILKIEEATARAKEIIPVSQRILSKTLSTKSKFINEELLSAATERLPKKGVDIFLQLAKEEKGILFGSKSRAFQLAQEYNLPIGKVKEPTSLSNKGLTSPFEKDLFILRDVDKLGKFKLIKVPRDIELRFDTLGEAGMKDVTNKAIERLRKLGTIKEGGTTFKLGTAREIKDTPFAIEAKINNKWEKVAEFKGGSTSPIEEAVPEYVVGIKKVGTPFKTKSGITATTLSEELRGVTQGVLRVRVDKTTKQIDIFPPPKRMKDIGSVSVSARTLEMSKPSSSLKSDIIKFESLFDEKLVREQVQASLETPERGIISDFRPVEITISKSTAPSLTLIKSRNIKVFDLVSPETKSPKAKSSTSAISLSPKMLSPSSSSVSPYVSKSPVGSISPSGSPISSLSPISSPSPSPSLSPISPYVSPSISPSPRISPSISPSPSRSPSPSPSPYRIPPPSPKSSAMFKKILGKISTGRQAYEVQIRRAGKFSTIAKGLPLGKAKLFGAKVTTSTLGQTFRLLPKGTTEQADIGFEVPKDIFTRLKRPTTKLEYVERRGKTLKRGTGEIPQILSAKRRASRRTKWL